MSPDSRQQFRVLMILDNPCDPDWRVLKEAHSLAAAGFSVRILAWDRSGLLPKIELIDGVRIVRVATPSRHRRSMGRLATAFSYWARVMAEALAEDFDAIHSHDLPDLPISVFLSLRRRRPLVYDAHELYWMDRLEARPILIRLVERYGERLLIRRAKHVVTVSDDLATYYRRLHPRVSVVGNWYDPIQVDRISGRHLRHELGIADDTFCLVYAGSLGPERNHQLLIEYAAAYPDTAVVVAGKGGVAETDFIKAAGTLPNLRFLGWQTDLGPVYGLADALYYVLREESPYRSISSPNNFFVSIAAGIPLITTASGEPGRLIAESGAGELLHSSTVSELHRAVDRLRNPQAKALINASLSTLRVRYTWGKAAEPLVKLYRGLARR